MKGLIIGSVAALILAVLVFSSFDTVSAGHRGVRLRLGAVQGDPVAEGFYWLNPFTDDIVEVNVQTQKIEVDASAASSDLQTVAARIALNYNVDPARVSELYQKVGLDFETKVIIPSLEESIKSVTAKYTASDLISRRSEVNGGIFELIKSKLSPYGITVEGLNIVNFNFSDSFNKAIEDKVTAEQNAKAAENKLKQIEFEAQQAVATARGKAEALTVEASALRSNPEVIELRWIERWNGVLPSTMTGDSNLLVSPR